MNPLRNPGPLLCLTCVLLGSCRATDRAGPYAPPQESERDEPASLRLTEESLPHMDTEPERAESLLRRALNADLFNGPAHNNLGVLLLRRGDLYGAASEFEWARKLSPGHPDPRLNLALTLEQAGRTDEALDMYATALEVYPDHLPSVEALARLQIRTGRADDRTPRLLDEIALRGSDEAWRNWARLQRVKRER
ncbi:MAG: tetratricopeptide repeat protein [Phycisphaerae bacterium]|nr:tetratricopeptide repeat protein [Phycisphaerae bacterium]